MLDNCEHVAQACARLAAALLIACPALRVLATSRQPIGVPGEQGWTVAGLEIPAITDDDLSRLGNLSAVRLSTERVAARPHLELTVRTSAAVADICRRLDGNPLALELAATRRARWVSRKPPSVWTAHWICWCRAAQPCQFGNAVSAQRSIGVTRC